MIGAPAAGRHSPAIMTEGARRGRFRLYLIPRRSIKNRDTESHIQGESGQKTGMTAISTTRVTRVSRPPTLR
jgi:hypothetical protein